MLTGRQAEKRRQKMVKEPLEIIDNIEAIDLPT